MRIKAFVFDCGGVLLRDGDESRYRHWEKRLGLLEGELKRRLWTGELWTRAERGDLSEAEFWSRAGEELGLSADRQIERLARDLWDSWHIDEEVLGAIDETRQRYRVAMLSNASDALEEQLAERYGVADRFELIVNSSREGVAKPEAEIYRILLDRMELEAEQVVFIDDRPENVSAAAELGMHVIWFVGARELWRQLAGYLAGDSDDAEDLEQRD